jgi:hypothetical protein
MIRACVVLIASIVVLSCASTPASACYVCAPGVGCYPAGQWGGDFCFSSGGRCYISGKCSEYETESVSNVGGLRVVRPANPSLEEAIFVVQSLYKLTSDMLIYR